MKVSKKVLNVDGHKPFTVIKTEYNYEPDIDGTYEQFLEDVLLMKPNAAMIEPIPNGLLITEMKDKSKNVN